MFNDSEETTVSKEKKIFSYNDCCKENSLIWVDFLRQLLNIVIS